MNHKQDKFEECCDEAPNNKIVENHNEEKILNVAAGIRRRQTIFQEMGIRIAIEF